MECGLCRDDDDGGVTGVNRAMAHGGGGGETDQD